MKRLLSTILVLAVCPLVGAQTLQTAYFSDNYTYSYRLNPAFHPGYSFVGLPFIGTTSGAYKGSFALKDLFYSNSGERVTFMNDAVPSSEFLGKFKKGLNSFSTEAYTNLFAAGFKAGGMYNIVEVNMRNYNSGKLPYDLFRFLKEGAATNTGSYDLSGLRAHSTTFAEIAITSSWKASRKLTVGMRFKGLIGRQDSFIDMERMTVSRGWTTEGIGDTWMVNADGVLGSAYDGYQIASKPDMLNPSVTLIDLQKTRVGKPKGLLNGYGVGADFGILYDDSSWQYSFSLSDIGCIFWFHNLYGHAKNNMLSKADFTPHKHGPKQIDNEFSDMGALLGDVMGFIMEDEYQNLGLLPVTARFGVKYLYLSDLSFGGLATF
ncbi:MAG: hypothetical protein IK076_01460, partial [Bacteroidales bacterium]|nr:hypothetical protein [Bacteroidales bacterium]